MMNMWTCRNNLHPVVLYSFWIRYCGKIRNYTCVSLSLLFSDPTLLSSVSMCKSASVHFHHFHFQFYNISKRSQWLSVLVEKKTRSQILSLDHRRSITGTDSLKHKGGYHCRFKISFAYCSNLSLLFYSQTTETMIWLRDFWSYWRNQICKELQMMPSTMMIPSV